jgi:hypothetical protein
MVVYNRNIRVVCCKLNASTTRYKQQRAAITVAAGPHGAALQAVGVARLSTHLVRVPGDYSPVSTRMPQGTHASLGSAQKQQSLSSPSTLCRTGPVPLHTNAGPVPSPARARTSVRAIASAASHKGQPSAGQCRAHVAWGCRLRARTSAMRRDAKRTDGQNRVRPHGAAHLHLWRPGLTEGCNGRAAAKASGQCNGQMRRPYIGRWVRRNGGGGAPAQTR